jgi:hypothetical protein
MTNSTTASLADATEAVVAMFRNAPPVDAARIRADLDGFADQTFEPRG